jgi:hypothetical protein
VSEIRSRQARDLAEAALVRLVHAYGGVPEFILLGGLVPDLLCSRAVLPHVGTTDVDVQVDLEIQSGMGNTAKLERALIAAGFHPDSERVWRWRDLATPGMDVKVEFLTDREDIPAQATVRFNDCDALGAVNLRGTGFAAQEWELRRMASSLDGRAISVELRVAALPGYLLAKIHAAHGRGFPKDWYDVAYVLLHNDQGGPRPAGRAVAARFEHALVGSTLTALRELAANFAAPTAQGCLAYSDTMLALHPDLDGDVIANDALVSWAGSS